MPGRKYANGTPIRFVGKRGTVNQPIGEITGYHEPSGAYECVFYVQGKAWRPKLLPAQFSVMKDES